MRIPSPLPFVALLLACAPQPAAPPTLEQRIDAALESGLAALVAAQSPDGAWRSATYGALEDDWTLTATCTKTLAFAAQSPESQAAFERGLARLASAVQPDGSIDPGPRGLPYPVYTAAMAVIAFARATPGEPERWARARDAWLQLLEAHQLVEALGWVPQDPAFGGWSYASQPPRKGAAHAFESDLSSTVFALGALRIAGREPWHPSVARARAFVLRCQNLPLAGEGDDPARDDGGFFMSPSVSLQNKAAGGWRTPEGRLRHASYGSMSADGLRALLRLGLGPNTPRVQAARGWLESRFDAASNPGAFEARRRADGESAYHYWAWSAAHAFTALELTRLDGPDGRRFWPRELAEQLLELQREDGTWSNRFTMMKEDDPLVATPLALAALALARLALLAGPD